MTERWLSKNEAVALIQSRLGRSTGHAQATLETAINSREVRERDHPDWPVLLVADDGVVGMTVLSNGQRLQPGASMRRSIQISEADLIDWLDRTHGKGAPAPKSRAQSKRDRAKQAIDGLWPQGIPREAELSNKSLIQQVAQWITDDCKTRKIVETAPGNDTILRAAGRK